MTNKTFRLTEDHIKLLRAANISWQNAEFGAPCVDGKRPYGNSNVIKDLIEILGIEVKTCPHCEEPLDLDEAPLCKIHLEVETALQIVLATGSFAPGLYDAGKYGSDWALVDAF